MGETMDDKNLEIAFRLPIDGWPRALFRSNFSYDGGTLHVGKRCVLAATTRTGLETGLAGALPSGEPLAMRLVGGEGGRLVVEVDGCDAPREGKLYAPPSRSAWIHGIIGLGASALGFLAGYIYLVKAELMDSAWAMKMGNHTAMWHLLLVLTLFPASVWGQRLGIRSVQFVSSVFFFIHVGIATANAFWPDASSPNDVWIALFNALSGVLFLASVLYGQKAHRDMDPVAALKAGLT
jgi:hypothetical protein